MPGVTVVGGGSSFPATAFQAAALNFSTYIYPEDKFSYTTPASDAGEPFVYTGAYQWGGSVLNVSKKHSGLVALPALGGGLSVAFNLPGLTELLLSRKVLPRIFDGTIHSWDDPGLVVDNPTLAQVHQPIMVIKRYDMSGSTILFKKALSLMDRSTGFAMSPYESDTFKMAENNSVMVDTSQQSGVIVGKYPYTITYLSPIDALAQSADMASIQHINGDFIPCTTEKLSNSINSIDFETANSLNPYTDFAVAIDLPVKEAYPLTRL
ncbi:hypothetical protein HDU79_011602 [Rhizoclosmatium sp. JEL0117]|nr:hypothetical protein HDU79_011602 [Rhizoclosmatium sp. JEL0117]